MKTMKFVLLLGLIFVHYPPSNGQTQYSGVVIPQFTKPKTKARPAQASRKETSKENTFAEVELLRMMSPSGNEVIFSLSREVMGRSLSNDDYNIEGVSQKAHSVLCQKTINTDHELERAELKLELELMIEDLRSSKSPRFLTGTQRHVVSQVPLCEEFQLQLTAINKLIQGYSFEELAMTEIH